MVETVEWVSVCGNHNQISTFACRYRAVSVFWAPYSGYHDGALSFLASVTLGSRWERATGGSGGVTLALSYVCRVRVKQSTVPPPSRQSKFDSPHPHILKRPYFSP